MRHKLLLQDRSGDDGSAVGGVEVSTGQPPDALRSLMEIAKGHHRTTAAVIAETLHAAIIQGVIAGGTALRQDELASILSVSRMPIREALRQLEVEGLIAFTPHKGAVVACLVPEEVEEIAELRVALEGLALSLSLPHLDAAKLDTAEAIVNLIDGEASLIRRNELNREFHATLYSGVQRPRLERQIRSLYDGFDRYLRIEHSLLDRQAESQKEHRRILDACRRGNVAVALAELAGHVAGAGASLSALIRRKDQKR